MLFRSDYSKLSKPIDTLGQRRLFAFVGGYAVEEIALKTVGVIERFEEA